MSTSGDEDPRQPAGPMRSTAALFTVLLGGIILGLLGMLAIALAGR